LTSTDIPFKLFRGIPSVGGTVDGARDRTFGQWWDANGPYVTLSVERTRAFGIAAYEHAGAAPDDARFLIDTNLDKAIQGDHARGLVKVPGIIRAGCAGSLDFAPTIEVVREKGATAVVDGGKRAFGRLVCRYAMTLAVDRAREHGIAIVGARATGELLTPFVSMAADAGMVGMALVQSVPTVAPLGGFRPLLGNAPMAIAVPARDHDPVILDMSFTQSSASGVLLAASQGERVPPGMLLDEHGDPTTDASAFPDNDLIARTGGIAVRGTLSPLGNSHKGYAMVFMIGLLSSVLTDTSPPWDLAWDLPERGTYGTVLIAIDPNALNPNNAPAQVDAFIDEVTSAPRRNEAEPILYPGQRSQQLKRERRARDEMSVPASHLAALQDLAHELGLEPPIALGVETTADAHRGQG
jgi:LDH2 family malate/lactate/ureidoglycolate dehydrogenase